MNRYVLNKISKLSDEQTELSNVQVELANTFNDVVETHKYLEKTIKEAIIQFNEVKKWVQGNKNYVEQNLKDLNRIQTSLKELGLSDEANELSKYLSSDIYKEYEKIYNATK